MKTVLVPTDFSENSKGGVQFAINWAAQQELHLVFIHILYIVKHTEWTDVLFEEFTAKEAIHCKETLELFIDGVYKELNVVPASHSFEIIQGISADISILDYCTTHKNIDFICISTRGAGKLNRLLGTNTGNLITKSKVPVLAIPQDFEISDISNILFATDFKNFENELDAVINFAQPFKAGIEIIHYTWPDELIAEKEKIEAEAKNKYPYPIRFYYEKNDGVHSLVQNLQNQIELKKTSLVVMFTNQERTFFQKIFLSSKTEELSFQIKVPLLVFNKSD